MSKRNLSAALFHGTNVELNPGDMITPAKSGPRSLAFATENADHAAAHASMAAGKSEFKIKHRDSDKAKYSDKGIVYKVEPVGDARRDPLSGGKAGGVWVSKTGFKVVGRHE